MLESEDLAALRAAAEKLENPGFVIAVANFIGMPVQKLLRMLPERLAAHSQEAVRKAVAKALDVAVGSLGSGPDTKTADRLHRAAAMISGGVGGSLGLASTLVELPVTTVIMLRSIAGIARREGEDLNRAEARLACVEVFALGGPLPEDDAAETGYYAVRAALAKALSDAAKFIAGRGIAEAGAPPIVRFLAQISARFGIAVSEKAAAQAVPVAGALGGAAVNLLFMDHFQKVAHGHFTIRRLERKYGREAVRTAYDALLSQLRRPGLRQAR